MYSKSVTKSNMLKIKRDHMAMWEVLGVLGHPSCPAHVIHNNSLVTDLFSWNILYKRKFSRMIPVSYCTPYSAIPVIIYNSGKVVENCFIGRLNK